MFTDTDICPRELQVPACPGTAINTRAHQLLDVWSFLIFSAMYGQLGPGTPTRAALTPSEISSGPRLTHLRRCLWSHTGQRSPTSTDRVPITHTCHMRLHCCARTCGHGGMQTHGHTFGPTLPPPATATGASSCPGTQQPTDSWPQLQQPHQHVVWVTCYHSHTHTQSQGHTCGHHISHPYMESPP